MLRCYQDTPYTGEIQIALLKKKTPVSHADVQSKSQEKKPIILSHKYIINKLAVRALTLVYKAVHTFKSAATPYCDTTVHHHSQCDHLGIGNKRKPDFFPPS